MKQLLTFLVMSTLAFGAAAQNRTVSVSLSGVSVIEFLQELEKQSGFTFAYNNSDLDLAGPVTIKSENEDIVSVIERALSHYGLTAKVQRTRVIITSRPVTDVAIQKLSEEHLVSGKVTTESGEPLPGASIVVKGSINRGVIADQEGVYTISAGSKEILVCEFLGFYTKEVKVGERNVLDIVLQEDNELLEEVLVVGYTPMRKSDFTGSIASVKSNELVATVPTIGQALAGKVAGVEIRQVSGAPGDGVNIRVRGVNSLSASSTPLYVIDGYPAQEDVYINPSDIESIDILKDAASAAIYGSRGASGVVLITTKRGKDGESPKITYEFSYGLQQIDHKVKLLDAYQFRDLYIDSRNNSYMLRAVAKGVEWSPYDDNSVRAAKGFSLSEVGIHPMFYDFKTQSVVEPEYNTDWQDEVFSTAGIMRHNISVRGGGKSVKYMASIGYMDQDGIISPSNHNRLNARVNLDVQITSRLNASISYSMFDAKNREVKADGRMISDGIIQSALMYLPNLPAYDEDGDFARSAMIKMKTEWGINFPENPLVIANELDINEKMNRHNVNAKFDYDIVDDLTFSARIGRQWYNSKYSYYRPMSIGRSGSPAYAADLAEYNIARSVRTSWVDNLGEFTLSYKKKFGEHRMDAMAGYTLQKKENDKIGVEATGFTDDRIHDITAHGPEASDVSLYETNRSAWSMMSCLARLNWSFSDRYTVTGTFRADGSSRFGVKNRWGYFPSVSAGWTLSNEPFLKSSLDGIAGIRIRASWGKSGNNDIGNYASVPVISTGGYGFGNTAYPSTYEGTFTDAALGWETTTQTNVGIDLDFLDHRINVIANWYNSVSSDILYSSPLSSISGSTSATTNMKGTKIRNRGFDFQVDARILTGELTWNMSANISVNRNKVVSMGGIDDIISTSERSVGSHITKEGYPIGSFYGYNVVGIMSEVDYRNALKDREIYLINGNDFPDGYVLKGPALGSYDLANMAPGFTLYEDVNGDGIIDTDDKTIIGDAYPDFTGGISTNFSWKGLDLSMAFTYSYGGQVINFQDYYLYNMEGSSNQYAIAADRYISDSQPGMNNVPLATRISTTNTSFKLSSYYVEDASYFRCANVTVGYSFPKTMLSKVRISDLRVFVSGDNLFTLSPYRGYNPEVSYKSSNLMPGFDWGCYPLSRIISAGLSITF